MSQLVSIVQLWHFLVNRKKGWIQLIHRFMCLCSVFAMERPQEELWSWLKSNFVHRYTWCFPAPFLYPRIKGSNCIKEVSNYLVILYFEKKCNVCRRKCCSHTPALNNLIKNSLIIPYKLHCIKKFNHSNVKIYSLWYFPRYEWML